MSQGWQEWLAEQRAQSTMIVEQIPLTEVNGWGMREDGLRFGRPTPAFFNLIGLRVEAGREVAKWDQPILEEVGQGVIVLVRRLHDLYFYYFLVQAKAEPGNPAEKKHILLAPTLQVSKSNLEQAHGGKKPPRSELLLKAEELLRGQWQDGGRFREKLNHYCILDVSSWNEVGELNPNERWMTVEELREAFRLGECNQHLRECLALLW